MSTRKVPELVQATIPTNGHLRAGYIHPTLRAWQSTTPSLTNDCLLYPVFVSDQLSGSVAEAVPQLPGVARYSIAGLVAALRPLIKLGLRGILLFGVVAPSAPGRDLVGTSADAADSVVLRAVRVLRAQFPSLLVACDLCLCMYTSHGHCGILAPAHAGSPVGKPLLFAPEATAARMAQVALAYAQAGADMVAPSSIFDGVVRAIKRTLQAANYTHVAVMAYSAKFASSLYGPFRAVGKSHPTTGSSTTPSGSPTTAAAGGSLFPLPALGVPSAEHPAPSSRSSHQLPPSSLTLAQRATARDEADGTDFVIVKPGSFYLDVLASIASASKRPVAVYHVSGEHAMLVHAGRMGAVPFKQTALELITCFRRAGAALIITYLTPWLLEWLADPQTLPPKPTPVGPPNSGAPIMLGGDIGQTFPDLAGVLIPEPWASILVATPDCPKVRVSLAAMNRNHAAGRPLTDGLDPHAA